MQQTTATNPSPYDTLTLMRDIVRDTQGVYALRVKGNGLIDARINDGDIVVMRRVSQVKNGALAAVWIKPLEQTTLRRWFDEGERVRLQPENPDYRALYYRPDEVEVQGLVIAVIRQASTTTVTTTTVKSKARGGTSSAHATAGLFDL